MSISYKGCVATKQATTPTKPPPGQPKPTIRTFRKECNRQHEYLEASVLALLTQGTWLEGEAKELGVQVSPAEVQKEFERYKRLEFRNEDEFRQNLALSDVDGSVSDLLLQIKLALLAYEIEQKILRTGVPRLMSVADWKEKKSVSEDELNEYYGEHKEQLLTQPERKDVRIIVTNNEAQAQAAESEIQSGQSFESVARRVSVDPQTKASGGLIRGIVTGRFSAVKNLEQLRSEEDSYVREVAQGAGLAKAKLHELIGPERASNNINYKLYEAVKVYPEVKQTRAQFKQQTRQEAWHEFLSEFREKWRARTNCPGHGTFPASYLSSYCKQSKERFLPLATESLVPPDDQVNLRDLARLEQELQGECGRRTLAKGGYEISCRNART